MKIILPILYIAAIFAFPAFADDGSRTGESPYTPSILIVDSDDDIVALEAKGVIVWHKRADMVLCAVPKSESTLLKVKGGGGSSKPRRALPTMDYARAYFGADKIHSGESLPRPYSGKGVVVGFCDTGFDPNHIAFLDDTGMSRVKRLVYYNEPEGERKVMDDPREIADWSSDSDLEWHGTHVANTIAGGYRGNGYYGMAPDAEIVGCTSKFYDAGILAACEDIVDYAKSVGKPAVINLSLGSYNGPHDGSSLFCRYLDLLAEDAIVCLSSGNEGAKEGHYRTAFSKDYPSHRTRFTSSDWLQFDFVGATDVWSHDDRPVSVRLAIYDAEADKEYYLGEYIDADEPFNKKVNFEDIPELAGIFTGNIEFNGYVSPLNGRWVTEVEYDSHTEIGMESVGGKWARYELGLEFKAEEGVVADMFSSQSGCWFRQWWGWNAPDTDMSVSDLCTGKNTISVGMYSFRNTYPQLDGETVTTPRSIGYVHPSSSYGVFDDGRVYPLTVGPGDIMISACNSAYIKARPDKIPTMQAQTEANGKTYYWVACNGTSMSCPFTAGTIACWLEAAPNLTVSDVQRILRQTNSHEYANPSDPRHGYGWLNPYEGIKYVIADAGVLTPGTSDAGAPGVVVSGGVVEVFNPGCRALSVEIFSVNGAMVRSFTDVRDPVCRFDISSLAQGAYIVRLSAPDSAAKSVKFIIAG